MLMFSEQQRTFDVRLLLVSQCETLHVRSH